ncbi:hypothetical protein NEI07_08080, partial [Methylocystis sp. NLS-7]|nr:hypothetical protein [Methylocystis suflitae]
MRACKYERPGSLVKELAPLDRAFAQQHPPVAAYLGRLFSYRGTHGMARGISTILTAVIFGAIGFGLGIYAAPTEGVANLKAAIEGRFKPAPPAEEAAPGEAPATTA